MWTMKHYRKHLLGRVHDPRTLTPVEVFLLYRWTRIRIETHTTPRRKPRRPLREPSTVGTAGMATNNTSVQTSFNDSNRVY